MSFGPGQLGPRPARAKTKKELSEPGDIGREQSAVGALRRAIGALRRAIGRDPSR